MFDKWFEVYAHWPPGQQLGFSAFAVVVLVAVAVLAGLWLQLMAHALAVAVRGWPPEAPADGAPGWRDVAHLKQILDWMRDWEAKYCPRPPAGLVPPAAPGQDGPARGERGRAGADAAGGLVPPADQPPAVGRP